MGFAYNVSHWSKLNLTTGSKVSLNRWAENTEIGLLPGQPTCLKCSGKQRPCILRKPGELSCSCSTTHSLFLADKTVCSIVTDHLYSLCKPVWIVGDYSSTLCLKQVCARMRFSMRVNHFSTIALRAFQIEFSIAHWNLKSPGTFLLW